tara:strand:- start:206 stop:388 length:183 start_codon:yes stop_codon:yes gene_type:complete
MKFALIAIVASAAAIKITTEDAPFVSMAQSDEVIARGSNRRNKNRSKRSKMTYFNYSNMP